MENYEQLVERISRSANLEKEEIERRVEAKRAKLSGLVSKEGAAQIVAAELGINFDQELMKLSEIVHGMKRVNTLGKIVRISPIREFSKNGREGKVANLLIADETSNAKLVLWDINHIALVENGTLKEGDVIEISNGGVRNGEIHLSSFADIKKSKEKISGVVESKPMSEKKLKEAQPGDTVKTRAVIVQAFEPRYFEVNAKTGKKLTDEDRTSGVETAKRALLSLVLDDGTESMRSVAFGEQIKLLGLTDDEIFNLEAFQQAKKKILGEELYFIGQIRNNQLYNSIEMTIQDVEKVDPSKLIEELEK